MLKDSAILSIYRRRCIYLAVICWLCAAPGSPVASAKPDSGAPDSATPGQSHHAELHQAVLGLQREHNIGVLGYALLTPDRAPLMHMLGGPPAQPMRWGSITKTVTALTLLAILAERNISVYEPLHRWLDPALWRNPWATTHPLRLLHLLEMTTGLPELSRLEFDFNEPLPLARALQLNPEQRVSRWPPGQHHSYSNATAGLSQQLIERLSGLTYAQAVQHYVAKPLHLSRIFFTPHADLPGGFKADGVTPIPYWHMTFAAFGGMNAPIGDLVTLAAAIIQADTRLGPLQRRHLLAANSTLASREGFDFEYAAGLYPRVRQGGVWWGHGGDADGYRSRLAVQRDSGYGYVAVINSDNPPALRQLERLLESHLAGLAPAPSPPPIHQIEATALRDLTGLYRQATRRFGAATGTLRVVLDDESGLQVVRGAGTTPLLAVSPLHFRRRNDPQATVAFVRSHGKLYVQGVFGNYVREVKESY